MLNFIHVPTGVELRVSQEWTQSIKGIEVSELPENYYLLRLAPLDSPDPEELYMDQHEIITKDSLFKLYKQLRRIFDV